jgi:hypothetical protein
MEMGQRAMYSHMMDEEMRRNSTARQENEKDVQILIDLGPVICFSQSLRPNIVTCDDRAGVVCRTNPARHGTDILNCESSD